MKNRNLYDILGVAPNATHEQIRASYRARAKRIHPDNQDTGNTAEFARLQIAHATLTDADSRSRYDATGEESGARNHSPSNTEANALSLISTISQQVIDGGFGVDCDLTRKIRETITLTLSGHRANRDAGLKVAENLRGKIDAINRRWTGADAAKSVVVGGLQQRIESTEAGIRALDATITICELAVSLMDGAVYDMPIVKPTASQMAYITHQWKIGI